MKADDQRLWLGHVTKLALVLVATSALAATGFSNENGVPRLVIVGRPDTQPATWFDEVPDLVKLKNAVSFTLYSPDSPEFRLFQERYPDRSALYPIVAYLRESGGVIYFADRHTLPANGETLLAELKAAAFQARNASNHERVPDDLEIPSDGVTDSGPDVAFLTDGELAAKPILKRIRPLRPLKNPTDFSQASSALWIAIFMAYLSFFVISLVLMVVAIWVLNRM